MADSAGSTDEFTPMQSGGETLLAGAAGIGVGALILASGPVGWAGGLVAAMSISSGVAGIGIGTAQVATSSAVNDRQERRMNDAIQTTLSLTSSPGATVGGTAGVLITGDESGLATGLMFGGLAEGGGELAYGGYRLVRQEAAFEAACGGSKYTWNDSVRKHIRTAKGLENPGSAATRYNPAIGGVEGRDLSHLIPQRIVSDDSRLGRFLARDAPFSGVDGTLGDFLLNRPWNVRPMWRIDHPRVNEYARVKGGVEMLPDYVRGWRRTPEPLLDLVTGGAQTGHALDVGPNDDPKD